MVYQVLEAVPDKFTLLIYSNIANKVKWPNYFVDILYVMFKYSPVRTSVSGEWQLLGLSTLLKNL